MLTPTAIDYRRCFDADATDPDAGRDFGEPDVDPRDFRAWLSDYVSDAHAVLQATDDDKPHLTSYRAGLHGAALEILARYHQETDTDDLPY